MPLEAIVHEETYHDYAPEDIDRLYAYKESLPENKQFILENNKETLAQVFTDVRYKKEDNEVMSENLWKVIKKQGFNPAFLMMLEYIYFCCGKLCLLPVIL